ncbi:MAG: hypothetical protein PHE56_14165 [Bacteroidales bacterium]|jgi:hypothetical protein|nr:hypothetical protein [Bacteroidales bacterium]
MENFERVEKQQRTTYIKYKFLEKQADLYLTNSEIIIEARKTAFRGLGLLNRIPHLKVFKRKKEVIIPIDEIKSVSFISGNQQLGVFGLIDKAGKEYKFEMKNHDEWIDLINEKLDVGRN